MQSIIKKLSLALFVSILGSVGAQAQSLAELASQSKFVSVHHNYLQQKNARSVYASTNPICPSIYWMQFNTNPSQAKQRWGSEVSRQMQTAGFPQNVISKCVASGAFVYEELNLRKHPKNAKYSGFMVTGVMLWEKSGDYSPNQAPVFVQTNDYTGSQTFRMYDQNFKEICSVKSVQYNFKGSCKGFGNVSGRMVKDGGRWIIRWEGNGTKAAVFTGRTVSYARSKF